MGFSSTNAQLLSAPPYILACVGCILIPHFSDRCKQRGYCRYCARCLHCPSSHTLLNHPELRDRRKHLWQIQIFSNEFTVVAACFALMTLGWIVVTSLQGNFSSGSRLAPGYIFICLSVIGNFATSPLIIAWGNNNTAPAGRRAMVSAFLNTVCNFGGIVGSFMYVNREAPAYNTGNGITMGAGVVGCACAVVLHVVWKRANGQNGQRRESEVRSAYADDELLRLGDRGPLFRYME